MDILGKPEEGRTDKDETWIEIAPKELAPHVAAVGEMKDAAYFVSERALQMFAFVKAVQGAKVMAFPERSLAALLASCPVMKATLLDVIADLDEFAKWYAALMKGPRANMEALAAKHGVEFEEPVSAGAGAGAAGGAAEGAGSEARKETAEAAAGAAGGEVACPVPASVEGAGEGVEESKEP